MSVVQLTTETATGTSLTRWQRVGPVVSLLLLSPILAEVHFGAIRFTVLFALIPAIGAWGCGALMIRELVVDRRRGWDAIILLGIALSIAEECIIQQTSLAPLVGLDPLNIYGRAIGVNWIYFLWAIGYESIWAVVIPIYLVEVMFPSRRASRWTGKRGFVISAVFFLLASLLAWFLWTQIMIPQLFPDSAYAVPRLHLVVATLGIVAIAVAGFVRWPVVIPQEFEAKCAPNPWIVAATSLIVGLCWFGLVFLAYGAVPQLPWVIPFISGVIVAVATMIVLARWSACSDWCDAHAIAAALGALTASMLAGFVVLKGGAAPFVDYLGKAILNGLVMVWLIRLLRKQNSHSAATGNP